MGGSLFLLDLPDVCARTGYPVEVVDGWETRGRQNNSGYVNPPIGIVYHHTASPGNPTNDINYIAHWAEYAPIANLYLQRQAPYTITVCAAGPTNHAGSGSWPGLPDNGANARVIGIEAAHDGKVTTQWPQGQLDAYVKLVRELMRGYPSIREDLVIGHLDWAPGRKVDPGGAPTPFTIPGDRYGMWSRDKFLAAVKADTPPDPPIDTETTMLLYAKNKDTGALHAGNGVVRAYIGDPNHIVRMRQAGIECRDYWTGKHVQSFDEVTGITAAQIETLGGAVG